MMFSHDVDVDESVDDLLFAGADDESEFLPIVGNLLRPKPRPAVRPLPRGALTPNRPGVDNAVLSTPGGTATVRLPEKVVTQDAFREATQKLETTLNNLAGQLNATRADVARLTQTDGTLHTRTQ
jgi:hypothetical protein